MEDVIVPACLQMLYLIAYHMASVKWVYKCLLEARMQVMISKFFLIFDPGF